MTRHKSFKNRIRARMEKTGESYTTARRQLTVRANAAGSEPSATRPAPAQPSPATGATGQTARISDALVRDRTGRGWDEWFALLDAWGATGRTHTEIARWLVTTHEVSGWWAQSVTVGYEQTRGLRAPGQRRGGDFSAAGSRTVGVPVQRLFDAFADDALRRRWLPDAAVRVRTSTPARTFRADWGDGPTRIVVGFAAVDAAKSRVSVQHEKLTGAEQAAELKAYWRDRLAALKELLEDR
ncbi:hypothetical protein DER29_3773 [Micromonospora sp. M71_S20]|uniref:DUF4287 domain-containing protein n=1 Tax=Micromonospora sp. M71_S20 TaxID=592872 RepID=UPI000F1993D1|nr:DUF4287 domain-containing protein [Micromonospora sp. M71_S20]RLK25763.1 hypothetical protein DER29_3773 [Micromonospora sp. M71_S20]